MRKQAIYYRPFMIILLVIAIAIMVVLLWPFRHALIFALILASIVRPFRSRLPLFIRLRSGWAALVLTLLTVLVGIVPLVALMFMLAEEVYAFSKYITDWFKEGNIQEVLAFFKGLPLPDWLKQSLDAKAIDIPKIQSWALSSTGDVGLWFFSAGKSVFSFGLQFFIMVMLLFYILAEGNTLTEKLRAASPLRREQEDAVIIRFKAVSKSVLLGGLGTSLAIGFFTGIGLWIAGISPLLWGSVAVIASLVPVVGLSLVMIPAIVYLLATNSWKMAIFLLLYWLLVVNSVDNVLRPIFMRGQARMSLVWVFMSIIGGLVFFGALGFIYGPLALSISFLLFQIFIDDQRQEES